MKMEYGEDFDGEPLNWPAHWVICSDCHGEGSRMNPAIDGNGISTSDECWQDDDFREMYLSGGFNISCDECGGTGKIKEIDEEQVGGEDMITLTRLRREEYESYAADRSEAMYFGYNR